MSDTSHEQTVHPLHKSYTVISTKHVDYDNLSAFEATAMSLALILSVSFASLAIQLQTFHA